MLKKNLFNQNGFGGVYLIAVIGVLITISTIGYSTYYSIIKAGSDSNLKTLSSQYITQGTYILATESSDVDGDGFYESPAMKPDISPYPVGGGQIPDSSGATKTDAWGTAIGYCSWDHGTDNSSLNRINGNNPGAMSDIVFAVVSAGPDKTFNTTCANLTAGTISGDDGARWFNANQIRQGVGGTVYYGDPVADSVALNALNTGSLKDGELRLIKDTNQIYRWNGSSWDEASKSFWSRTGTNTVLSNAGDSVGIGVADPGGYKLNVNGSLYTAGGCTGCSDIRWKKDIVPINNPIDTVLSLNGVRFNWKSDEYPQMFFPLSTEIGFVAQDVEKIIPELIYEIKGYKYLKYEKLTPLLVEAIKSLKGENDTLKTTVNGLEKKMETLESNISGGVMSNNGSMVLYILFILAFIFLILLRIITDIYQKGKT